tara:strand:+ start:169 stop:516 length:348 start_codon:yes stop_codon:yes gene_type:complete
MANEREKRVAFVNDSLREAYNKLKDGKFEDKELYGFVSRAIDDLKKNPLCGDRVPNKQIPKEYLKRFGVNSVWKYNLPNAWRLIYTVVGDEVKIVSMILEWMSHKDYNRRFRYNK